ncbi:hypothetical protein BH23CHL7_BH23CHL7_01440 [soil metagenome]
MIDPDERTLEQFRRRMEGLEDEVPDPLPLLGMDGGVPALPVAGRPTSADPRPRNVYALLAIVLVALVAVALPYAVRPQPLPLQPASAQPRATVRPVVRPSPLPVAAAHCPTSPELFDVGGPVREVWASADWALIEGRLQAEYDRLQAEHDRLTILATDGPFAGPVREVSWPDGYSEAPDGRRLVLFDDRAQAVAGEHELVRVGIRGPVSETVSACAIRVIRVGPAD